jgi:SM-20-related protein
VETSQLIAKYELLLGRAFLDESLCKRIIEETRVASQSPATVYGRTDSGLVDEHVRRASRLNPSLATVEFVKQRLLEHKQDVERHFKMTLSDVEEPQFLRYGIGDFFVAHQDGNTGLIRLNTESDRKISIVVFLNSQSEQPVAGTYCGGSLKFSDYRAEPAFREYSVPAEVGMLVAFRAELTHEVTPVVHGERYSIVSWYQ